MFRVDHAYVAGRAPWGGEDDELPPRDSEILAVAERHHLNTGAPWGVRDAITEISSASRSEGIPQPRKTEAGAVYAEATRELVHRNGLSGPDVEVIVDLLWHSGIYVETGRRPWSVWLNA